MSRVGLRDTEERIQMWYVSIQVFYDRIMECIFEYTGDSSAQEALEEHFGRFPDTLLMGL